MPDELSAGTLQKKWEETLANDDSYVTLNLRLRRAISWIGRAEREMAVVDVDLDATFIFYWIAFNAAYGERGENQLGGKPNTDARGEFAEYFSKIIPYDTDNTVYDAIWKEFSGPIRVLLNNKFVFEPFWHHHNQMEGYEKWEEWFENSKWKINQALANTNTEVVLSTLFGRLYVLRNQLLHGGATWNGSVNRNQVRDGAKIMGFLTPHFINLMIDNPNIDWGLPHYPVVQG